MGAKNKTLGKRTKKLGRPGQKKTELDKEGVQKVKKVKNPEDHAQEKDDGGPDDEEDDDDDGQKRSDESSGKFGGIIFLNFF